MSNDPSVYDYLAKQNISELTVENLNTMTSVSSIDKNNLEFWAGVITVSRAMEHSRTFPHGLPIPLQSDVVVTTISDGSSATVGPTGNEVWLVNGIDVDNCLVAFVGDGGVGPIDGSNLAALTIGPIYLTRTLKLTFNNASGSTQTPAVSYHKVAL
jgi:hypothetical protein